jgi:signal transduction histidine kinase
MRDAARGASARRSRRRFAGTIRGIAGLWRLAAAVALLAVLWVGTVSGVERASREADERRESDRSALAAAFAESVRSWLDAGSMEATTLARTIGASPIEGARGAIDAYLAQDRTFTQGALVLVGGSVVAASSDGNELVGLRPQPCTRTDEAGAATTDRGLDELVSATSRGGDPVVSRIFELPGDCRSVVAVAVGSGALVTVAVGDVSDLGSRLLAGSLITDRNVLSAGRDGSDLPPGGTRVLAINGDVAVEPKVGVIGVAPRVAAFVRGATSGGRQRARYALGDDGAGATVLAAYAPIADGWSLVLEQDAALFDIERQNRPSLIVASVLTVVFAVVFGLLAVFDLRRRRAHRRAEVAKNVFFSIAGHELRTPLTVIKGFAEALSEHWDDFDDERRSALVRRIVPQTRRLDRLVERLLVAASIQAETHTRPQIGAVDLSVLLADGAERFRAQAPLHTFTVAVPHELPLVAADGAALDQVLDHLVDNAVKYSPAGGRVVLSATSVARGVEIAVEDEGIGLPSDHRHIFDKFVQGESVTKRVHDEGGVGLGLYIVRTLVEEMGGSVRAEDRVPEGARFVVTLRASRQDAPRSDASHGLVRSDHV